MLHESNNSKNCMEFEREVHMYMQEVLTVAVLVYVSMNAQNKFAVRNTEGEGETRMWSYCSGNCPTRELVKKW